MGYLDTIALRDASRPQGSRPPTTQRLTWDDRILSDRYRESTDAIQTVPPEKPQRSDRVHPVVIWSAGLIVVASVAVAAWLGARDFETWIAPATESLADAPPAATQAPAEKPAPKRRTVRSAAKRANPIDAVVPEALAEASNEASASAVEPVSEVANGTETEAALIETVSDPGEPAPVAAVLEDNYVYSSEATGVIAPQLVSLGFVHPLLSGFETRRSRLELVISKSGTVERAKIFSRSRNWEDAMLLSRAKTFQFVPAQRDGFPVRYRYLLDVTTTP
jgi:hypothetical protein